MLLGNTLCSVVPLCALLARAGIDNCYAVVQNVDAKFDYNAFVLPGDRTCT